MPGRQNFYPRPPRGGRQKFICGKDYATAISIHALREEGDLVCLTWPLYALLFLSTPSARRATSAEAAANRAWQISIHALREEGDDGVPMQGPIQVISIHALREEGDHGLGQRQSTCQQFLSTPSARRATAKTETKSLFSNKLYNILHEFRRALIYNGSKNYPNHAK